MQPLGDILKAGALTDIVDDYGCDGSTLVWEDYPL